ncbi:MAG TPA: RuBisCO large subunit C-terminal-like domain-containing protein [Thermoanaerobaculia bacterium]|nr:RuBisCO large subunit C-terminal-like domain-containing protein [Thermoanaerobaculia bacterium]
MDEAPPPAAEPAFDDAAEPATATDDDRLRIVYDLACEHDQDAFARAREIAFEQTVELPEAVVPPALQRAVVGRLEGMERLGKRRWRATISYAAEITGGEVPQLLNLLYGNVSLLQGVRVVDLSWPRSLLAALPGPAFGIEGVRRLLPQADGRALLCTALKPIGLTSRELANLAGRFARGGVDVIKDDHGLADQMTAPFAERVGRIQQEVRRAAEERGAESLYLPHLTGPLEKLPARLELLRNEGVRGALVSPFVLGLDALRWLAKTSGLVLFAHPTWSGTLFAARDGIAPEVVYGDLLRLLGADAVIYVNAGGRFPVAVETCEAINARLRRPLDGVRPAFPVAGGGVRVETLPRWAARYGPDTIFLVGGSLYLQHELEEASRRLVQALAWQGAPAAARDR